MQKLSEKDFYTHHAFGDKKFKVVTQTGSVAIVEDENGCKRQVEVSHLVKLDKK